MPETESIPVKNIESVLQETLGSPPKIQSIKWKHLTDPGENFGSLILSIDVDVELDGKSKTLHIVAKLPPRSDYLIDLFNSSVTFKKELYFYRAMVPAFLELQLENGMAEKDLIKLFPHFYGGRMGLDNPDTFDEQALIVLENLNYSGYSTQDRIIGLDKDHMEFAVKELAKFHALPVALRIKKPKVFEEVILPGLVSHNNEISMNCIMEMVRKAQENLKNMNQVDANKVDATLQYALNEKHQNKKPVGPWYSMVHNDFWVNNMLFHYNEKGCITNMKIVDFQLGIYEHCVDDLIFFLISSAKREIIDKNLEELIGLYYDSFVDCLRSLNIDTKEFSRESFDKAVMERAPIKFPQCIMMAQVIKAVRGSAPDVQSIESKDKFLDIGKGKLYNEKLLHIMHTFDKNGWLKT